MKSQIKYNRPLSFALLQVYLALMAGDEIDSEYFTELTGFEKYSYKRVIKLFEAMCNDLHLKTSLVRLETDHSTNKTEYVTYRFTLSSVIDYSFRLPEDLDEEKRIIYLPVITYLKLRKRQYISTAILSAYFPNFTRDIMSKLIKGLKNVIGEELYKDELQSFVIEEI